MGPYISVVKTACNTFTIENLIDSPDTSYVVNKFVNDSFSDPTSEIYNDVLNNLETITLTLDDGIYQIVDTSDTSDAYDIIILDCVIRDCKNKYFNDLIYCNTETNCDCDDCEEKDRYDFNAFMIAFNLYLMIDFNIQLTTGWYYISPLTIDEYAANLAKNILDCTAATNLMSQMSDYCNTCNEPCKTC